MVFTITFHGFSFKTPADVSKQSKKSHNQKQNHQKNNPTGRFTIKSKKRTRNKNQTCIFFSCFSFLSFFVFLSVCCFLFVLFFFVVFSCFWFSGLFFCLLCLFVLIYETQNILCAVGLTSFPVQLFPSSNSPITQL